MTTYRPPLRDMEFALYDLAGLDDIAALPDFTDSSSDVVKSVLEEAGAIAENILAPTNQTGDRQGARLDGAIVRTPNDWARAYRTLVDGNWIGLSASPEFGGMGLPGAVNAAVNEMWQAANMAFGLCPLLTQGAINAIASCANEEQRRFYLPKLVSGEWTGTMNLTESSAGSDLGAIRTRAVPQDGHYLLFGQKIFITYGDHDLTDNIVHLVLARTPDAPPGIKGISLFIVPKILVDAEGNLGKPNDVHCVSLEHKMGIHGSPTSVMSYGDHEGAIGYLVGEENHGLEYMFVMMNDARLNVGIQGLGIAERAYQQARAYALERVQGKPVGAAERSGIVDHPDVRRMLMNMKAEIEAMRALAYVTAACFDTAHAHQDPIRRDEARRQGELLTPIVKGWCTERAIDIASVAVQVHGGVGYIEDTGAAQHLRDARITTIYEGTTAIQANDLVNRKILRDRGATLKAMLATAHHFATVLAQSGDEPLSAIGTTLQEAVGSAESATDWLIDAAARDPRWAAAAGVPLLTLLGTVLGGYQMARAARLAHQRLQDGAANDPSFYQAKLNTAWHYAEAILPRARFLEDSVIKGSPTVMTLTHEQL